LESVAHPGGFPSKTTSLAASPLSPGGLPPLIALTGLQSARHVDLAPYCLSAPALTFSDLRGLESTSWQKWGEPPAAALSCPSVSRSEYHLRGSPYPSLPKERSCLGHDPRCHHRRPLSCITPASTNDIRYPAGIAHPPFLTKESAGAADHLYADTHTATKMLMQVPLNHRSTVATKTRRVISSVRAEARPNSMAPRHFGPPSNPASTRFPEPPSVATEHSVRVEPSATPHLGDRRGFKPPAT